MLPVSVVIIAKNEAGNIRECIRTAAAISSDIIVVDCGSTDNTIAIAAQAGVKVIQTNWKSYAHSRNTGAAQALNDWIFALDADERITSDMAVSILAMSSNTPHFWVFGFKRENYFINKKIRFGDWGHDVVYRLYNRNQTSWKQIPVHETLNFSNITRQIRKGSLLHYTVTDMDVYADKMMRYAFLSVQKQASLKQHPGLFKKIGSPLFNFFNCYFIRLGFLDGKEGFIIAFYTAWYSWMKYNYNWDKTHAYKLQALHK